MKITKYYKHLETNSKIILISKKMKKDWIYHKKVQEISKMNLTKENPDSRNYKVDSYKIFLVAHQAVQF